MMKSQPKPLSPRALLKLRPETLRRLTAKELGQVQGGTSYTIQPIQKPGH
jgi:hypothetical protein